MSHGATFLSAVSGAPWDDVAPLARVLEVELAPESATISREHGAALWKKLSYLGSNDLAYLLRGFEGVDYPEIVRDVCKQLKIADAQAGEAERVVEHNEQRVLAKIFADAWEHTGTGDRRELLRELNLDEGHLQLAGSSVAAAVLAGQAGPFAVYKLSLIVANSAARALPARRLAAARRKTAQAVVLVASLRQAQRTALAETALADAQTVADADEVTPGAASKARRPAKKKATQRPPPRQPRAGKKAAPERPVAPQSRGKKAAKKKAGKKKVQKKAAGKKKRSRAGVR